MVEGKVRKSLFSKHQWVHIDFFVKEIFEKQLSRHFKLLKTRFGSPLVFDFSNGPFYLN